MNRLLKLGFLALLFCFFLVAESNAQGFNKKYRYWSLGITLNAMNYVGELDPGPSFISPGIKFTRYNFGAVVSRRMTSRLSIRGTLSYGRVSGNDFKNSTYSTKGGDIYRKARNLDFFSNILEVKGDVVIDFIEHRGRYQKRPDFVPYAFVGLGYFHMNPKTTLNGSVVELRDLKTEGQGTGIANASKPYSLHQIALPIGIGLRYKLSKQLDLAFEIGWRFTTTDYLDDVGGKYVDKNELYAATGNMNSVYASDRTPEIVDDPNMAEFIAAGHFTYNRTVGGETITSLTTYGDSGNDRGDKKGRRDAYIITGFHLTYIIPSKVICPKFR